MKGQVRGSLFTGERDQVILHQREGPARRQPFSCSCKKPIIVIIKIVIIRLTEILILLIIGR